MITALITLYNPTGEVVENITTIATQVDRVILCDNSPSPSKFRNFFIGNILYTYNDGDNLAISSAYNKVLNDTKYNWNDEDYIIFFDQDSIIPTNHVNHLIHDFEALESDGYNVGCLGPIFFDRNSKKNVIQKQKNKLFPSVYSVQNIITSSMLCRYKNLSAIGFWNESVFLDMADWDLCWRFIEQGYLCCITKSTILSHNVGKGIRKASFIELRVDIPCRNYYQIRDGFYLLHKTYAPLKFKIRFWMMLLIRNPLRLLLLDNKNEQLFYMKSGYFDWKAHKTGAITHYYNSIQ